MSKTLPKSKGGIYQLLPLLAPSKGYRSCGKTTHLGDSPLTHLKESSRMASWLHF